MSTSDHLKDLARRMTFGGYDGIPAELLACAERVAEMEREIADWRRHFATLRSHCENPEAVAALTELKNLAERRQALPVDGA